MTKQKMKLQKHTSKTGSQFRIGIPKKVGDALGWEHGDFLEFSVEAKDTIKYKKVKL